MTEEFDFREYGTEPLRFGPFTVTQRLVEHPIEAYALSVTAGGRRLVYTGDTGPCNGLTRFAQDADLLLAEAAFRDDCENPPSLHLTGSDAARVALEANARRLVLTHIAPWHDRSVALDEAATVFTGPTDLAVVGACFEI